MRLTTSMSEINRGPACSQVSFGTVLRQGYKAGLAGLAALMLSACASQEAERPVVEMTRAETAIQNAARVGGEEDARGEMQSAERHLEQAQQAIEEEEFREARWLAEKAEADAQLAEAKARNADAYETVAELQEGIRILQEELNRAAESAN